MVQIGFGNSLEVVVPSADTRTAILGGGDVAFPMIFAGAVMKTNGLFPIMIVLCSSLALIILLLRGDRGKFYPAMPFMSAGCFVGLLLTYLFIGF